MKKPINQRDSEGRKHGVWEDYYINGRILVREHYMHGKAHRLREWYHTDGTPYFKKYFLTIK
jgi:antitoxin component YwqK of YwqJK toxin-antitoxin module